MKKKTVNRDWMSIALIKERVANVMNYGKGGVEMFDECFEILKGLSN